MQAIDELFEKRYALEVSEQKASVDPYSQSRRRSYDSTAPKASDQDDIPSRAGSSSTEALDANASFALFVLQTYRKKYGLRQLVRALQ